MPINNQTPVQCDKCGVIRDTPDEPPVMVRQRNVVLKESIDGVLVGRGTASQWGWLCEVPDCGGVLVPMHQVNSV